MTAPVSPAADTLIAATGIGKTFGDTQILSDITLSVHRGEVVTVIGPNGAGKSTLLRILMGVATPDCGTITRKPGLVIGYVPQRIQIDAALPLTVGRFLGLTCRDSSRIADALAEVGVHDAETKPVQTLSGGELRRVMLARAILRSPDLLVLDEPLAGVDVAGQAALYELIGNLRRRYHAGILMVSHDLHLVMAETDHVICLNHHVCCAGHPETVSRHPAYAQLFGSAVAIYTHDHDHAHGDGGEVVPLGDDHDHDHGHHHGGASRPKERANGA
jgi:zinc transport system ATP-binding protein